MLKIKDNVDLKELEKYGFEDSETSNNVPVDSWGEEIYSFRNKYFKPIGDGRRGQEYYLFINKNTKILAIYATEPDGNGTCIELSDVIYDLIKADLVEKVEKE